LFHLGGSASGGDAPLVSGGGDSASSESDIGLASQQRNNNMELEDLVFDRLSGKLDKLKLSERRPGWSLKVKSDEAGGVELSDSHDSEGSSGLETIQTEPTVCESGVDEHGNCTGGRSRGGTYYLKKS